MKITSVLIISSFIFLFKPQAENKTKIVIPSKLKTEKLHQPPKYLLNNLAKLKQAIKNETYKRRF